MITKVLFEERRLIEDVPYNEVIRLIRNNRPTKKSYRKLNFSERYNGFIIEECKDFMKERVIKKGTYVFVGFCE